MTILVTGATGHIGRIVVDQLMRAGVPLRATSRTPETADLPAGLEVARADLARPETLPPVLEGVDRMYMMAINGMEVLETAPEVVDAAKKAGVRRIVLLSSSNPFLPVEHAIEASGLEWTHLRPGEFCLNTLDYWRKSIREENVARFAYPEAQCVPIHELDIVDVAVAALLGDGHAGKTYELTGPEPITQREQVRVIGAAIGREIRYEELTHEQAREHMIAHHLPGYLADYILSYQAKWVEEPPVAYQSVLEATGRPGRTFAQWAADHADDFR